MNIYLVLNKVLRGIHAMIVGIALLYFAYLLSHVSRVAALLIVLAEFILYLYIKYKLKQLKSKKTVTMTHVEKIEHEFGCTYRERYYNKNHIMNIVILFVVSFSFLLHSFSLQLNSEVNDKYTTAMSHIFELGEMEFNEGLVKSSAIILPNTYKETVVFLDEVFSVFVEFIQYVETLEDLENADEKVLTEFNEDMEYLKDNLNTLIVCVKIYTIAASICYVILKFCYRELRDLTYHRSITLSDKV